MRLDLVSMNYCTKLSEMILQNLRIIRVYTLTVNATSISCCKFRMAVEKLCNPVLANVIPYNSFQPVCCILYPVPLSRLQPGSLLFPRFDQAAVQSPTLLGEESTSRLLFPLPVMGLP